MKKFLLIVSLLCITGMLSNVNAKNYSNSSVSSAIKMYKAKNYSQSYTVLSDVVKKDPSNALAYYYLAMTAAQIGKKDEAINNYQRVLELVPSGKLNLYATKGKTCLESPDKCNDMSENTMLDQFVQSKFGSGFSEEARGEFEKQKIENLMREMNRNESISPDKFDGYKDFSSQAPSNDEIVNAFRVLQRAGLFNLTPNNVLSTTDLSVLGSNGMNSFDSMQMLMQGGNNSLSPQVIQSLLTNQMSVGF